MSSLISMLFVLGVGFYIGATQSGVITQKAPFLQAYLTQSASPLVRCAADVQTKGWELFRDEGLAFQLQYPETFTLMKEASGITLTNNSGATITMMKMHSTLKAEVAESMVQGGWKIADRSVYALTTPYFSNDDGSLNSTYLFIRGFPKEGTDGRYAMVRATITLSANDPDFAKAREQGIVDVESILNVPEQILSTFRFLTFEEM